LRSDLGFLKAILDDNSVRWGQFYPGLVPKIISPSDDLSLESATVMVTALDSISPIVRRTAELLVRRVIVPFHLI